MVNLTCSQDLWIGVGDKEFAHFRENAQNNEKLIIK